MSEPLVAQQEVTPKRRRWPIGLLVGFVTALVAAFAIIPIADWAMEMHHVSTMEGNRACAVVALWMPGSGFVGFVLGFIVPLLVRRGGFLGYLIPQGLALLAAAAAVGVTAVISYATAIHAPLLDGRELALEIEVEAPAKGRSIEALKAQDFSAALLTRAEGTYADMRWADAVQTDDTIRVTGWAPMRSTDAGRQISVGVNGENRQLFVVMRTRAPKKIDEDWSEWETPRTTFSGSMPAPNDQYRVRYRVRFANEYSPTPAPDTPVDSTPIPDASSVSTTDGDAIDGEPPPSSPRVKRKRRRIAPAALVSFVWSND